MNHITASQTLTKWSCDKSEPHPAQRECVESLIRDHGQAAYSYAYHLARRREAAQDLVQTAFLKTLRKPPKCGEAKSLRRWLFTVIRNHFVDCTRKRGNWSTSLEHQFVAGVSYADIIIGDSSPLDQLLRLERINLTQKALAQLKDGLRKPMLLRDVEGHRYARVARILGLRVSTVRSRIHRARLKLKQKIEALEVEA